MIGRLQCSRQYHEYRHFNSCDKEETFGERKTAISDGWEQNWAGLPHVVWDVLLQDPLWTILPLGLNGPNITSGVASSPTGPAMAGPVFEICTFARRSMASTSVLRV